MSDTLRPIPEDVSAAPAVRTQWHRILGQLFELLLTPVGVLVQVELPVLSEPPKADILLVRRSGERWTEEQRRLLCDGLRDAQAATLLIEFKFGESLNDGALLQALSYDYFYRQTQNLGRGAVQAFVMVARTPRTSVLKRFGYETSGVPGLYRSGQALVEQVQVIVLNQLRPEAHNAFVQSLASQRRVRNAAFARLQKADMREVSHALQELLFGLHSKFEWKGDEMSKAKQEEVITPESLMKIGREIRQMVIANLTPEERLAGLAPEERLAGLSSEERKAAIAAAPLEERLAGLAPEEMARLMEQIEAYLRQAEKKS